LNEWHIYRGTGEPHNGIAKLPKPPRWRSFDTEGSLDPPPEPTHISARRLGELARAKAYQASADEVDLVNAALYLRRPLLVTGKPGTGKSTLAHSVARELKLGPVLKWPITSRSSREEGLYRYDALSRLHDSGLARDTGQNARLDIGRYIRLGPLGTALLSYRRPRVLLIDELDKSDIDLPNDLLAIFEDGEYEIPELSRIAAEQPEAVVSTDDSEGTAKILGGKVSCHEFPLVVLTSNGEREFPLPFHRRCLPLKMRPPERDQLEAIVRAHLGDGAAAQGSDLIETFIARRRNGDLATDQLLNAIYLTSQAAWDGSKDSLIKAVMQHLSSGDS
jgi:MoxR-like ATPase